jgi:ribonuclease HI
MGQKYYAVRSGRKTGIFLTWEKCKESVHGFAGAEFKSFKDEDSALTYLSGNTAAQVSVEKEKGLVAYVDGSFRDGVYSCGCVILLDGEVVAELSGTGDKFPESRNVSGEILGAVKAIEWGIVNGYTAITICHDYNGVGKWASSEWKANSPVSREYKEYMGKTASKIAVSFKKVTAHSGNIYNERADKLAGLALPKKNEEGERS